jgi:hypothetical protein
MQAVLVRARDELGNTGDQGEKNVSTENTASQAQSRLLRAHGNAWWPQYSVAPPRQKPHQIDAVLKHNAKAMLKAAMLQTALKMKML